MADASANIAGAVSVEIGATLAPMQAKLDQAQAILVAWDAKMAAIMSGSGSGASAALAAVNTSAAQTAAALNTVTAPAAAAVAKIDALGASATVAATGVDASGISAKALAAALAMTGNNLEKATALMVANADAAKAQAAATDTVTASTVAATEATAALGVARGKGAAGSGVATGEALVQSAAGAAALNKELANTSKLGASASVELTRMVSDAALGRFGRLESAIIVMNSRLGESGASALTFRNALGALGNLAEVAFNPMIIALVGIPLALNLAVRGFESLTGSGQSLNDVLKAQSGYLSDLSKSFPEVAAAAKAYAAIAGGTSASVAAFQGTQTLGDLQKQYGAQRSNFSGILQGLEDPGTFGNDLMAEYKAADSALGDTSGKLRTLVQDFVSGKQSAQGLANALAQIYISPNTSETAKGNITQFEQWALAAANLKAQIDADQKAIALLNSTTGDVTAQFQGFQNYLKSSTASLQQQIDMVGKGSAATAAAAAETKVWSDANITASTDLQRLAFQAEQAGAQIGTLTAQLAAAQAHSDLTFSLSLIGLSSVQQQVASQLRGKMGDNTAANLNSPAAKDLTLSDELSKFNALTQHVSTKTQAAQLFDGITKSGKLTAAQLASVTSPYKGWLATLAASHGGGGGVNAFNSTLSSITKQTDALKAQIATFGQSTAVTESAKVAQQLLDAAIKDHIALSPKLRQAIQDAADKYGAAKQQLDALNAAQKAAQEQMRAWKDMAIGASETFASTFISDLRQGSSAFQSFADAASQALDQIANKLIDMAIQNLWSNAFGGSSGGNPLGFLGSLFGGGGGSYGGAELAGFGSSYASGSSYTKGGIALVGEQGPELVRMPTGARVYNSAQTAAMFNAAANSGTNDNGLTIHVNVDARGAQQGAGAEIATALTSFARNQLPTLIRQYNANPNRRGYVPYPAGA